MSTKIRLKPGKGCGAPPYFHLKKGAVLPSGVRLDEVRAVLAQLNGWIASQWVGWGNWGWLVGLPCLVRFVRNDLLLRKPLKHHLKTLTRSFVGASWAYHRKVKTYGYGETSETVVKISVIILASSSSATLSRQSASPLLPPPGRESQTSLSRSSDPHAHRRILVTGPGNNMAAKAILVDYVASVDDETSHRSAAPGDYHTADEGDLSEITEDAMSAHSGPVSRKTSAQVEDNLG